MRFFPSLALPSRAFWAFAIMGALLLSVGILQSWNLAFVILNLCIISAIMSLGVNIQWGYGGLFNAGIMGFAALGGMAALLVSKPPVATAWQAGGFGLLAALLLAVCVIAALVWVARAFKPSAGKKLLTAAILVIGFFAVRAVFDPAVLAIEADNPAKSGYLGGLGMPIVFSWALAALFAAAIAWLIGKVALGLRSDYLAIATLGISEILIAVMKNEDWLTRGVKNVTGLSRPVPYELDLQTNPDFIAWVEFWHRAELAVLDASARQEALRAHIIEASSLFVKLCYACLFSAVLAIVFYLCQRALASPWGRMMRAIRDNEISAAAMGKDVTKRHLQLFVLGSAVVGIAGAMLTTLDGQFTPGTYHPLRYTFLIWVMVIVGGSGNNAGAVLGGFLVWFVWVEAEPVGLWIMSALTAAMEADDPLRKHLVNSAQHMRLIVMGAVMLAVMRFSPGGILPAFTPPKRNK